MPKPLPTIFLTLAALITAATGIFCFYPMPEPHSLPNPVPGQRFADTWNGVRIGGRRHQGVDIFAKRGTPVRSTTSGVVLKVGENRLGGKTVSIWSAGRVVHYYAHLEKYADVRRFQWVKRGEVIGYVGDSGNAKGTPPHLHYGIYTPKGAVNPYPLLIND
ncbi:M23 family metallopeptidase [Neisseria chenwenguii]|uniref:Peptidase M23 n=1 Tax=Neisseria chenwenguii TaxID=1853278 RepID=A0A220S1W9_9NEIS|nr:M23 family metallopeptidase [Neisseria chenwenguii]ASK27403.1 peptidase M23 [Neisseria chenwenguii]ROV56925.1 M23 family metallopeptidase [Neisseria chenwenguii]